LPPEEQLGWVPYAWLIYLPTLFVTPILHHNPPIEWAITIAGTVAFLFLYFRAHWVLPERVPAYISAIVGLGIGFSWFNNAGLVFFIYGAGFLGRVMPVRRAVTMLAGILAIAIVVTWLARRGPDYWIPAVVFSALIGGVNIHYGQVRRGNAKLRLAQEQIEHLAQVAERERIARDLHDLLGHTLSVIVLKAEVASKLADRDPARAAREIREVEAISREALNEVRAAVTGYRAGGLSGELTRLSDALRSAGIEVETSTEPVPLSAAQEGVLALSVREAVTNVLRHSAARRCRIEVARRDGYCRLEVRDDGRGGQLREGTGLKGMRERVESIGGRIERDGNSGMRISIEIPVAAGNPE
jgi:two-component system sensor histidine kinase DesK